MLVDRFTEFESKVMSEHFDYLKDLTEKGIVILAGPTLTRDYSNFGIVILNAKTKDEARTIMQNDPSVINRVMRAELHPFKISFFNPSAI